MLFRSGHMRERIEIPEPGELEIIDRLRPDENEVDYRPYGVKEGEIVGRMAGFGEGHRYHITGLFHDEYGFPSNSTKNAGKMLDHLMGKIANNIDDISSFEHYLTEDAEYIVLSYGSTARSARSAINKMREQGIKVGMFRPITIWPFPQKEVVEMAKRVKGIIVAEMNLGQLVLEVERVVKGATEVYHVGRANGEVVTPSDILKKLEEIM